MAAVPRDDDDVPGAILERFYAPTTLKEDDYSLFFAIKMLAALFPWSNCGGTVFFSNRKHNSSKIRSIIRPADFTSTSNTCMMTQVGAAMTSIG